MPRDSSGNYSLPAGNPVVGGTVITATWANPTMTDIGDELTNSLDRNGRGGMLAPFKFADGTQVAPGITWNAEPTSGIFRNAGNDMQAVIAGVPRMRWTASSVDVWDTGTSTWLPIIGPLGSNFALTNSDNNFTALSINTFAAQTIFTYSGMTAIDEAAVVLKSAEPNLLFQESDGAADEKAWRLYADNASFFVSAVDDAAAATNNAFEIQRGPGAAIAGLLFGNAVDNPSYEFLGLGQAIFSSSAAGGAIQIASTAPGLVWTETDAAANTKSWRMRANVGVFTFAVTTDAFAEAAIFSVTRTAAAVTSITFGNATNNPTFSFLGTGALSFGGAVSVTGTFAVTGGVTFNSTVTTAGAGAQRFIFNSTHASGAYNTYQRSGTSISDIGNGGQMGGAFTLDSLALLGRGTNPVEIGVGSARIAKFGAADITFTVPLLGPAGAVGTPTYSFSGDTDTGIYWVSANVIGTAVGGQQGPLFQQNGSIGQLALQDGLVGFPGLAFASDGDTGIYRPASNAINFAVGGAINCGMIAGLLSVGEGFSNGDRILIRNSTAVGVGTNYHHYFNLASATQLSLYAWDGASANIGTFRISHVQVFFADGSVANPVVAFNSDQNNGLYYIGTDNWGASAGGAKVMEWLAAASGGAKVADPAGTMQPVGYRNVPVSSTTTTLAIGDVGKCISITAAINIPVSVFAAGDAISIYNNSGGSLSITISSPGVLRKAGTATTGTLTLLQRGICTLWVLTGGGTPEVIGSGNI